MNITEKGKQSKTVIPRKAFTDEIKQLTKVNEYSDMAENQPTKTTKSRWNDADKLRLNTLLETAQIDLSEELKPQEVCFWIWQDDKKIPLFALGDLSLITGQAKSKKTFLISLILSVFLGHNSCGFEAMLPHGKEKVIFIDTEQGAYDVQKIGKRISTLSGNDVSDRLIVFKFRGTSPLALLELVEFAIYNIENIGFIVIDGIKDLTTSINDELQANDIATKLMKWTEQLNIHILTVLHQNKGNSLARGHLGTELQNKAQTVLSVRRSDYIDNLSEVAPVQCRMIEPRPFAFQIDENGLPYLEDAPPPQERKRGKKTAHDYELAQHNEILKAVFEVQKKYKLASLKDAIAAEFLSYGDTLSQTRRSDFLAYYKLKGFIVHHPNGAHSFYTYNPTQS